MYDPNNLQHLSEVAVSNLITMHAAYNVDPRQRVPVNPGLPSQEIRLLRARLIVEEALETINALGYSISASDKEDAPELDMSNLMFSENNSADLPNAIDGCCDLIYVAVGALCAMGVPDLPHLIAVCKANNAKFPNGVAIVDDKGKYQKPEGWKPPFHPSVSGQYDINMQEMGMVLASISKTPTAAALAKGLYFGGEETK